MKTPAELSRIARRNFPGHAQAHPSTHHPPELAKLNRRNNARIFNVYLHDLLSTRLKSAGIADERIITIIFRSSGSRDDMQ